MANESIKIYAEDYAAAKEVRAERGLPVIEVIGCGIAAWSRIPKRVQDQIIRERAQARHAVEAGPAAPQLTAV